MTSTQKCEENPYYIPQLYVEGAKSREYLVEKSDKLFTRVKECSTKPCYGKVIYGSTLEDIIDILSKRVVKSFIVVLPPDYRRGLLVKQGSIVEPIPVEGVRTQVAVCEGEKISVGGDVGFVATSKREFRRIKSHVSGLVVYIYSSPESRPERNIVFIAPEESVENVRIE